MAELPEAVTTVQEFLGVDAIGEKGLVLRFLSDDGEEHHIQVPAVEAHALADMIGIALSYLPVQENTPRN